MALSTLVSAQSNQQTGRENWFPNRGNVGIGIRAPSHELEVIGTIKATQAVLAQSVEAVNLQVALLNLSGNAIINGNLGLGVANPAERLDILGNIKLSGNLTAQSITLQTLQASSATINTLTVNQNALIQGKLGLGVADPLEQLHLSANLKVNETIISNRLVSEEAQINQLAVNGSAAFAGNANFSQQVLVAGKLGIGIQTPSELLDVAGNGRFQGIVNAQEVAASRATLTESLTAGAASITNGLTVGGATQLQSVSLSNLNSSGDVSFGAAMGVTGLADLRGGATIGGTTQLANTTISGYRTIVIDNPLPSPTVTASATPVSVELGGVVQLTASGNAAAYCWFGNNLTTANSASTTATPVLGQNVYSVTANSVSNGCGYSTATSQVIVTAYLPDLAPMADRSYFLGAPDVPLSIWGHDLSKGSWTGQGVQGANVMISSLDVGNHNYRYTRTADGAIDDIVVAITALSPVNAGLDRTYTTETSVALSTWGMSLTEGYWSGPHIVGSTVVLQNLINGNYTYTYTRNVDGATDAITVTINRPLPALTASPDQIYCKSESQIDLATWGQNLSLGSWSGPGNSISNGKLNLNALSPGVHNFTYTRTADQAIDVINVTIQQSVAGSLTLNPTQECGTYQGSITMSTQGVSGNIVHWQYSLNGQNWSTIYNTSTTYTYFSTSLRYYRVGVRMGNCAIDYSDSVRLSVGSFNTGTISLANVAITCESAIGTLSVVGGEGTVTGWEYSFDDGDYWFNTNSSVDAYGKVLYRAKVSNAGCVTQTPSVEIKPLNPIGGGLCTLTSQQTCGRATGTLELQGHSGDTFVWQHKQGTQDWAILPGVTGTQHSYDVTVETWFRVLVSSSVVNCSAVISGQHIARVSSFASMPNVSGGTNQCNAATSTIYPGALTGSIVNWEQSPDNVTWSVIPNSAGKYPLQHTMTSTGYIRLRAQLGDCTPVYSPSVLITLSAPTNPGYVGLVGESADAEVINGVLNFHPTFQLSGPVVGQIQNWRKKSGTAPSIQINATTSTLTHTITSTTTFDVQVRNGSCPSLYSGSATFVINPYFLGILRLIKFFSFASYNGHSYVVANGDGVSLEDGFTFIANSGQEFFIHIDSNYSEPPIDQNYVLEETILKEGVTDADDIYFLNPYEKASTYTYFDGLGREMQRVQRRASTNEKDMVVPIVYDPFGRLEKEFLPFEHAGSDGHYKDNALELQSSFYHNPPEKIAATGHPFSQRVFEASPLNRVLEQGAPGADWQPGTGRTTQMDYAFNSAGEVKLWQLDETPQQKPFTEGDYAPNQLYVNITTDEHHNQVREYKDKQGLVILKRVQGNEQWLDTYYIYDDFNLLRYVIQPEGAAHFSAAPDEAFLNTWAFQYRYDHRQRMVEKRVPGSGWVYMVYDLRDRLVLTQDANQRSRNEWLFTKYDALNRPVITGLYTATDADDPTKIFTREELTAQLTTTQFATPYTGNGPLFGYDNPVFPQESLEVHTVTYYDSYHFASLAGFEPLTYNHEALEGLPSQPFDRVRGLATGGITRVLGTDTWLRAVTYYDHRYRTVQTVAQNHLSGVDYNSQTYDFSGKVMKRALRHTKTATDPVTVAESFGYDHGGRLLSHYHRVNNGAQVLLKNQGYNTLGQLTDKNLYLKADGTFQQSVDYRYNVRGWLTHINNATLSHDGGHTNDEANDYFGFELNYNTATLGGSTAQYNGNISEAVWKSAGRQRQAYSYHYDALNRLTDANYRDLANPLNDNKYNEHIGGYDRNGNIVSLRRTNAVVGWMDNLTYFYEGNQLKQVSDAGTTAGFTDGTNEGADYQFDVNGNMVTDGNKAIESIGYNHLNLPATVVKGAEHVAYLYTAAGQKVQQTAVEAGATKTTDYAGSLVYENNQLQFILHEEGRVVMNKPVPVYDYFLKDHLGNTRLTFTTAPETEEALATLEAQHETNERANFLRYDNVRKVYSRLMDRTNNATNGNGYALRLSGGPAEKIGLAQSLQVLPGDVVHMEVYGKYIHPNEKANPGYVLRQFLELLAAGSTGTAVIDGAAYNTGSNSLPIQPFAYAEEDDAEWKPKAYLNYVFLPLDFDATQTQVAYRRLSADPRENGSNVAHEKLELTYTATEPGYLYVFLSNDNEAVQEEVYFDDFKVTHTKSPVIQSDDYYPFGLTFNSYQRENSVKNQYLYNDGAERQDELDLNVDATKFRMYDPAMCRWWQVDPQSEKLYDLTPYNYSFNNPVRYNDPKGDCPPGVDCDNPLPEMQVRQNRASNLGPGYVRNDGTRPHRGHDLYAPAGTQVSSSMAGTVVSATNAGDNGYGNTVVVKTNTHPEAQPNFVGPPSPGGTPENNVYVQYSHLDGMTVNAGDVVTAGQNIGTVGTTGNASGMTGADVHLHIQVGTELNGSSTSVSNGSAVSPNLVYNNVSFESADPTANQTTTGVVKTVTNANGQQTRIHQQAGNTGAGGNGILLDEVRVNGTRGN